MWERNAEELKKVLNKKAYLDWKKRQFYGNELLDNNQSNIQSNNNFDLSQIYSMDSKMMESDGKTKYVPFSAVASSNNFYSSLLMETDYSQLNSKILDELRFVKLSGG